VLGTSGYIAPEQISGERTVDARIDVFALGCVFFECLVHEPAFAGSHPLAVLAKILSKRRRGRGTSGPTSPTRSSEPRCGDHRDQRRRPALLAKTHKLDRRQREAVLGLGWTVAVQQNSTITRRAELALRHTRIAADLGDESEAVELRIAIDRLIEIELNAAMTAAATT
jgi:serine/threonine protein kinase